MAFYFLLVPFLLLYIGLEAYGIWITIFILVSYVGVTTLGLSNVYMKYAAEFHARREYHKANALLSAGLAITVPLCGAIFMGFYFGWKWYSQWLHLPAAHAGGFTAQSGNRPRILIVDPASGTKREVSMNDVLNPAKTLEVCLHPGEIVFVQQSGLARFGYALQAINPIITTASFAALAGGAL